MHNIADQIIESIKANAKSQHPHDTRTLLPQPNESIVDYMLNITYYDENCGELSNTPSGAKLTIVYSDGRSEVYMPSVDEFIELRRVLNAPFLPFPRTIALLRMLDSTQKTMSEYAEALMVSECWCDFDDCCEILRDINKIRCTFDPPVDPYIGVGDLILDVDGEFRINSNHFLIDGGKVCGELLYPR
jgi:hypothetical protein